MKLALIIAILASCTTEAPSTPADPTPRWLSECGVAPSPPPMRPAFAAVSGDVYSITVEKAQWEAHVQWAADVDTWSSCVDGTRF